MEKTLESKRTKPYLSAALALIFALFLLIPSIATAAFGVGFSPVLSPSMVPAYEVGDLQITTPISVENLRVGDVILVRDESSFATFSHRIAKKEYVSGYYQITLKGDSNPTMDRAKVIIPNGVKVPKVTGRIPNIGSYVNNFSNASAKQSVIGLLVVLLSIALFRFALGVRKNKKENEC